MLNPITTHREFCGLVGALGISLGLPALLELFGLLINENYSLQGINLHLDQITKQLPTGCAQWTEFLLDKRVWGAYLVWFFGLVFVDYISPGKKLNGLPLRDGTVLPYKINGVYVASALFAILAARGYTNNWYLPELDFLYHNLLKLTVTVNIFSYILSIFVYAISFIPLRAPNGKGTNERILSVGGNTGNVIYDWFIGRELNPRIGSWDIKLFCELKPGMLLWLLINLSCAHHQYHSVGKVYDSLILVNLLQGFYVLDGVLNEEGVLSMIDVTTDGFGFMLCFGDLAWVPFSYSIQARYLALPENHLELGWVRFSAILGLMALGFYIFRAANYQKSLFKQGKLDHMKSIPTKTGLKLLCDGWWGMSQHINYFGDWLIGLSWCLTTGFQTPLTYFYAVYFASLLLHRQTRDEAKCAEKYGDAWKEFTKRVPWKIIPYVY